MYGLGGTCPTPGVACASSELKACMASAGIANRGRSSAPVPAVNWVTLGSLWPWCTSPGQWLSWPKGDGVKCSRSESLGGNRGEPSKGDAPPNVPIKKGVLPPCFWPLVYWSASGGETLGLLSGFAVYHRRCTTYTHFRCMH